MNTLLITTYIVGVIATSFIKGWNEPKETIYKPAVIGSIALLSLFWFMLIFAFVACIPAVIANYIANRS